MKQLPGTDTYLYPGLEILRAVYLAAIDWRKTMHPWPSATVSDAEQALIDAVDRALDGGKE